MNERRSLSIRANVFLLALTLAALLPGVYSLPPTDRDEARYVVASTQMLASGDFVDIRFQDEPRYLQPAGVYWLQSAAAALLTSPDARQIGAYRIPSVLGAAIAVLLTGWIGAFLFGRKVGLAAAVLLASCAAIAFEGRIAKTDAALLASITLAQAALLRIYLEPDGGWWRPLTFWCALGAGLMIKGPIILLFCGMTIVALAAWDRRGAWLRGLRAQWGAPLLLAIVLPWHLAIGFVSDWEFYARSVGRNLLGKVAESQQSHAGPPGFYLGAVNITFWPSVLFAVFAAPFAWRSRGEPAVRFLLAWIIPSWLVYELVATKLPHYVIPTYPALACLAAAAAYAPRASAPGWRRALGGLYAAFWVVVSAAVAALAPGALWWMEGEIDVLVVLLALAALALAVAALSFLLRGRPIRAIAASAAAGLVAGLNTFALTAPRLESLWLSPRIADAVPQAAGCSSITLATFTYREPSLVFVHGHQRTRLADSVEDVARLVAQDPACTVGLVDANELPEFQAELDVLGLSVQPVGRVEGLNYSEGDELDLTLFAAVSEDPP